MQKDGGAGFAGIAELLQDYTTLYCRVHEVTAAGPRATGMAYLKFRTFEDLAAVGSLAGFLTSFQVTGTGDPVMQFQARMRFIAFTAQFVQREYDPLAFSAPLLASDIRAEVARGAAVPDSFSTQASADLQAILFNTPTLPLETLTNTGAVRIDFEQRPHLPRFVLEGLLREGYAARVGRARARRGAGRGCAIRRPDLRGRQFLEALRSAPGRRCEGLRGELRVLRAARTARSAHGQLSG